MKYNYIGNSGLKVSSICLGTMTFGTQASESESFKILDFAYEKGINFIDTAELYPVPPKASLCGITENILSKWLKQKPRDSIILASKVAGAANGWFAPPVRHGLTAIDRFHIKTALENSLKRLKTDYIDLYQVHWPDTLVPIEEALEVFDELIKEGKIRYIGTSNDSAYGLTKANECAKYKSHKRFQSIQNNFSLLNPRFLDELSLVCEKENISLLAYSPLAGGVLSGKYNQNITCGRFYNYLNSENIRVVNQAKRFVNDKTLKATALYEKIANEQNIPLTTLAIAWTLSHKFLASSIIGATNHSQLIPTIDAIHVNLDDEILQKISQIQQEILYPMG